jgi:hypothetical protein
VGQAQGKRHLAPAGRQAALADHVARPRLPVHRSWSLAGAPDEAALVATMTTVKVIIVADDAGSISLETIGPVRGKDGLRTLLREALKLAEQSTADLPKRKEDR